MPAKISYSIDQCQGGAVIPFSGFSLASSNTYSITFSSEGSFPSNMGINLQPSGYTLIPSTSDNLFVYTVATVTGVADVGSAHLVKLSIYDNSSNLVHVDYKSIECGEACATQTPTPTATITPTPSVSISNTPTNTPSNTPPNSPTPSITATSTPPNSPTPTATPPISPSPTITPTQTATPTTTPTVTTTQTHTPTHSPTNTITPSVTPSNTETPLPKPVDFGVTFSEDMYDLECCTDPNLISVAISGQLNTQYSYIFTALNNSEYIKFDNISGTFSLSDNIAHIQTNISLLTNSETESLIKCRVSDSYNIIEDMSVIRCNNSFDLPQQ